MGRFCFLWKFDATETKFLKRLLRRRVCNWPQADQQGAICDVRNRRVTGLQNVRGKTSVFCPGRTSGRRLFANG